MANLSYNGFSFEQRDCDAMVNLSAMARAHGESISDWTRQDNSKAYVAALASVLAIPMSKVLVMDRAGGPAQRGVWGHPLVAIAVARWLSPEFYVWCNIHIKRLVETGIAPGGQNNKPKQVDASALPQIIADWIGQPCRADKWITARILSRGVRALRNTSPEAVRNYMRDLVRLGLALEDGEGVHYRIKSAVCPSL